MVSSIRIRLVFMTLALLLAGCDHATKRWAEQNLRAAPHIELLPGALDLRYAQNPGVAFSALTDLPEVLRFPLIVACANQVKRPWRRVIEASYWPLSLFIFRVVASAPFCQKSSMRFARMKRSILGFAR